MKTKILATVVASLALAFGGCSSMNVRSPLTFSEHSTISTSKKEPGEKEKVYPQQGATVKERKTTNVYVVDLDITKAQVPVFCQEELQPGDRILVTEIQDGDSSKIIFYYAVRQ